MIEKFRAWQEARRERRILRELMNTIPSKIALIMELKGEREGRTEDKHCTLDTISISMRSRYRTDPAEWKVIVSLIATEERVAEYEYYGKHSSMKNSDYRIVPVWAMLRRGEWCREIDDWFTWVSEEKMDAIYEESQRKSKAFQPLDKKN